MTTFFENTMEYAHQLSLKAHMILGFIVGFVPLSFLMTHWDDMILAFIVGVLTSFGAGLGKYAVERYIEARKKRNSKSTRR